MARTLRQTFRAGQGSIEQRLVGIAVNGVSWREVFEACVGFLGDNDVPPGHFAAGDLEFLAAKTIEDLVWLVRWQTKELAHAGRQIVQAREERDEADARVYLPTSQGGDA